MPSSVSDLPRPTTATLRRPPPSVPCAPSADGNARRNRVPVDFDPGEARHRAATFYQALRLLGRLRGPVDDRA